MEKEKRVIVWVQRFKDRPNLMLQWIDPVTNRRKSKSAETADPEAAEKARGDLEYELNHGKYLAASRMSWEQFRKLFEEEYVAGCRPNTRRNYFDTFELFERLCNPLRLRSINERTISAFLSAMRKEKTRGREGMMASTMHVRLQFLRSALRWAARQKLLPECPRFPTVKVPRKKPQPVPVESFERLYAKASGDSMMQAYLLCGWLSGMRLSEAYEIEWQTNDKAPWLDLLHDRIVLPAEFAKSVEDQWVPLDPKLRAALEALPRCGRKVFRFTTSKGSAICNNGLSTRIRRLAKQAGVKLTMHTLRKGFGCRYAGKVPAQVLQKLMRHQSIRTTMDYYANVDEAAMEAVLGEQRNSSRNTQANPSERAFGSDSANPSETSPSDRTHPIR
jgi:integrase